MLVRREKGTNGSLATTVPEKKEPKEESAPIMNTAISKVDFILNEFIS